MQNQTRRDILALGAAAAGGLALTAAAGKARADDSELLALYRQWLKADDRTDAVDDARENAWAAGLDFNDPAAALAERERLGLPSLEAKLKHAIKRASDLRDQILDTQPTTAAGFAALLRTTFWLNPRLDEIDREEREYAALITAQWLESVIGRAS